MILYQQIFFATLALAFALLHFVLYLYNRHLKNYLYFSIFLIFYALNIFFDYQATLSSDRVTQLFYLRLHRGVMPINPIFMLLFLYSTFRSRIPGQFWLISVALIVTGLLAVYQPIDNFSYLQYVMIIVLLESARETIQAIRQKRPDTWIIATGFSLLFLFSIYDLSVDLRWMQQIGEIFNGYPFGFFLLIITISIYLARTYAKMNEHILREERKRREIEIKQHLLEIEDARKSKELQEARHLQLSMLPQCITSLNDLEICFEMRPATEVGGDYYDYIEKDGTVIFAIGDATGHGMRAGMMVAIIKSLFRALAPHTDLPAFFEKCSATLHQMQLGHLYMALLLAKVENNRMTITSAGMPPFFIFRSNQQTVEELVLKGMPLGAVVSFPYQTIETELAPGDTVLLLTDGLPELFDQKKQVFDLNRVKTQFMHIASESADAIVKHLFTAADKWRGKSYQNDDITFLVIKRKSLENFTR